MKKNCLPEKSLKSGGKTKKSEGEKPVFQMGIQVKMKKEDVFTPYLLITS
jgi:hypothetical protein